MDVGRCGLIRVDELDISVIVRDVRIRSLVVDFLVEPTAGTGKVWVESVSYTHLDVYKRQRPK